MLPTATALATQRLAEFLAVVSRAPDVESAIQVATERAARALEAEVAVVLDAHGTVVSSVGFALGRVPSAALREVVAGRGTAVEVPGAGPCRAAVTQLDGSAPGHLVVARSGDDGFNVDEVSLLRGMARVLELTVESLRTIEAERRQAAENARLVTSLRERQRLLEQLSRIQRAITRREPLDRILDTITDAAQKLFGDEAVGLRMFDPDARDMLVLVASRGLPDEVATRLWRVPVSDRGVSPTAVRLDRLVVRNDCVEDDESVPEPIVNAMASPVHDSGRVVGSSLGSARQSTATSQTGLRYQQSQRQCPSGDGEVTIAPQKKSVVNRYANASAPRVWWQQPDSQSPTLAVTTDDASRTAARLGK